MVQSILSSMDSDSVNSISDTVESLQVANYLRDSYYEIISGLDLPNTFSLIQLTGSDDPKKPTLLHRPSNALNIHWIKYNKQMLLDEAAVQAEPPGFYSAANGNTSYNYDQSPTIGSNEGGLGPPWFQDVHYLELETFLHRMYQVGNNSSSASVNDVVSYPLVLPTGTFQIYARNDRAPQHWTSFDDKTILFDSYDASVDTTIVPSKTVCWGEVAQVWQMVDSYIPPLHDRQFTLLENEAKQQAFIEAKQSTNPLATSRAHKGWVRARRNKEALPEGINGRTKTTTRHWGRNTWPRRNAGTYRDHEPN